MARGINKVIIVGNCGNDPELRHTGSGTAVAEVSIATSESWKDKNTGEIKENTEWHRIVFWNRLAEIVGEYVKKGSQIYIEGKLKTESYEKDGVTKYVTKIVAHEMQMLGRKSEGEGGGERRAAPTSAPRRSGSGAPKAAPAPAADNFDDDEIPF